jgi:flagellar secretion chaperone FliS
MSIQDKRYGVGQYESVERFGSVDGADKLRLIQLMMQGAKDRIARAKGHLQRGETGRKGEQIGRAIQLIDGLRASLDRDAGAELVGNLESLYEYMIRKLLEANLKDDIKLLDEVSSLLGEVKEGWDELMRQAQAVMTSGAPSPPADAMR